MVISTPEVKCYFSCQALRFTIKGGQSHRRLQIDEAARIAEVLDKPFEEVVAHAGFRVRCSRPAFKGWEWRKG